MMQITKITFSPTGGTQKAVDIIAAKMGDSGRQIDLTDRNISKGNISLASDDVAIIGVPSFNGRIPLLACERLAMVKGNGSSAVIVVVYGNRDYEDTMVELEDLAKSCGFKVIAAVAAIAEHSIVRQYAAGRPDAQDQEILEQFAEKILKKLENASSDSKALSIPGNRPYRDRGHNALVPQADDSCVSCGTCAKLCPAGVISTDNLKTADTEKCISCMRCVVCCPKSARNLNPAVLAGIGQMLKPVCSERKENELFI